VLFVIKFFGEPVHRHVAGIASYVYSVSRFVMGQLSLVDVLMAGGAGGFQAGEIGIITGGLVVAAGALHLAVPTRQGKTCLLVIKAGNPPAFLVVAPGATAGLFGGQLVHSSLVRVLMAVAAGGVSHDHLEGLG